MVSRKDGHKYTVASIWREIARAHEEINGGSGERIFGSRLKPGSEAGAWRGKSHGGTGPRATRGQERKTGIEATENEESRAKVKMLKHTIVQMKRSKEEDRECRIREDYHRSRCIIPWTREAQALRPQGHRKSEP